MSPPEVNISIQKIIPDHIPEAFKKSLFWPTSVIQQTKKKPREKIPTVTTSDQWKTYYHNKEVAKMKLEESKLKRKDLRESKKKEKEKAMAEKKRNSAEAKEKRKRDLEEIRKIRAEKKLKVAEQKKLK